MTGHAIDYALAVTFKNQSLMFKLELSDKYIQIKLGWIRDVSIREKRTFVNILVSVS